MFTVNSLYTGKKITSHTTCTKRFTGLLHNYVSLFSFHFQAVNLVFPRHHNDLLHVHQYTITDNWCTNSALNFMKTTWRFMWHSPWLDRLHRGGTTNTHQLMFPHAEHWYRLLTVQACNSWWFIILCYGQERKKKKKKTFVYPQSVVLILYMYKNT